MAFRPSAGQNTTVIILRLQNRIGERQRSQRSPEWCPFARGLIEASWKKNHFWGSLKTRRGFWRGRGCGVSHVLPAEGAAGGRAWRWDPVRCQVTGAHRQFRKISKRAAAPFFCHYIANCLVDQGNLYLRYCQQPHNGYGPTWQSWSFSAAFQPGKPTRALRGVLGNNNDDDGKATALFQNVLLLSSSYL